MRKNILLQAVAIFFISLLFLSIAVVKVSAKEKTVEESRDYTNDIERILKIFQSDCIYKNSGYYYVYKEDFAGLFIDEFDILNVALTNNADLKNIEFLQKINVNYTFFKYPYNYLQNIMNNLELVMNDFGITSIEINDKENTVLVSLIDIEQNAIIEDYLIGHGIIDLDPIVIENDTSNSIKYNSRQINGAEFAYKYVNNGGAYGATICSNAVNNSTGELGIITCGHLGSVGTELYYDPSISNTHNYGTPLGEISYSCIGNSIDASFAPFLSQSEWIITPDANYENTRYSNIYLGNENQVVYGQIIARIGQSTGYTSGTITSSNVSVNLNGVTISNSFKISNVGQEGDSGGPVFYSYDGNFF